MSNLLYNNNDTLISLEAMHELSTPPALGRFHNPVPFGEYINEVHDALQLNRLEVVSDEYTVTPDGNRLFGAMEVRPIEGELITADDWKLIVGVRGSHDRSVSRGLVLGSQVMVCSNLCFSGDLGKFATKQTTNVWARLPGLIRQAVARIPEMAEREEHAFEAFRNFEMKPRWGDAALVEIHRRNGLSGAQLGKAINEWDRPSHEEHAEQGFSAWRLLNACTEAVKPAGNVVNMDLVQNRTQVARGFMAEVVGLA